MLKKISEALFQRPAGESMDRRAVASRIGRAVEIQGETISHHLRDRPKKAPD
jgi:hypothetical protein